MGLRRAASSVSKFLQACGPRQEDKKLGDLFVLVTGKAVLGMMLFRRERNTNVGGCQT